MLPCITLTYDPDWPDVPFTVESQDGHGYGFGVIRCKTLAVALQEIDRKVGRGDLDPPMPRRELGRSKW